jgi:hypothetical protein
MAENTLLDFSLPTASTMKPEPVLGHKKNMEGGSGKSRAGDLRCRRRAVKGPWPTCSFLSSMLMDLGRWC